MPEDDTMKERGIRRELKLTRYDTTLNIARGTQDGADRKG